MKNLRRATPGMLYLAPLTVFFVIVTIYPVIFAAYNSLFDWRWGKTRNFIGLENYISLIKSSNFWTSIFNTFAFALAAVGVEIVLGVAMAVLLNGLRGRIKNLVRGILLLPLMVSGIVVATVWKIMLDPTFGIIPQIFGNLSPTDAYLGDPTYALPILVGIDTWWQTAFVFIIITAALDSLPQEPFEAAAVDGAGAFKSFWHITLPQLRPWLLLIAAIRLVETLKVFDLIFGTTGGGPQRATETIQVTTYLTGFKSLHMSEAMALMMLFLLLIFAGVSAFFLIRRRKNA